MDMLSGEQAQEVYLLMDKSSSKITLDGFTLSVSGVTLPRLSANSEDLQAFDDEEGTKEFLSLWRAWRDADDSTSLLDECGSDDYDECSIASDLLCLPTHQSDSGDHDAYVMNSGDAPSANGWGVLHPYLDEQRIKLLDITRPMGNAPLHVLVESEDSPGFENLEPFVLHNIDTTTHEWTLVLETFIKGERLLMSVSSVRRIYAIVQE